MLYVFDLGNVIVDIDFGRVLGVWSKYSGVPLATLSERFTQGALFKQHEKGMIKDEDFAHQLCNEMGIALSFEQFELGWQAIFVSLQHSVIERMQQLRHEGHRVVILSNTNRLHRGYWSTHYPEVVTACDHLYLSYDLGMRKPDAEIFQYVLAQEYCLPGDVVFFDDSAENIATAATLGIKAIQVMNSQTVTNYFS